MLLNLRNYQHELITAVYNSMAGGYKRICAVLPTGAGKTVCFAWMAQQAQNKGSRVLFLVHRRELLDQTFKTFEKFEIPLDTIKIDTVIKTSNRLAELPTDAYDFVILDEAHHARARTWQRIIEHFDKAHILGLTATPTRLDGKPLVDVFDTLVIGATTEELINQGYLSDYDYYSAQLQDFTNLQVKRGEYDLAKAAELLSSKAIMGDVIKSYKTYADGMQAILFAPSVELSKQVAREFCDAGIHAVHFDGQTSDKKRDEIIEDYRQGKIRMLCNHSLIGEGFDVPACDCIIQLRPTQSLSIFLQQCGRALRPRDGKKAVIIDHVANYTRHGLPKQDRDWSLTESIAQQPRETPEGELMIRTCNKCFAVYPVSEANCPVCGIEYQPTQQEIKRIEEIKLSLIEEKQKEIRHQQAKAYLTSDKAMRDARSYSDFCAIARAKGYKTSWAYFQAKARGFWVPYKIGGKR